HCGDSAFRRRRGPQQCPARVAAAPLAATGWPDVVGEDHRSALTVQPIATTSPRLLPGFFLPASNGYALPLISTYQVETCAHKRQSSRRPKALPPAAP